MENLNLLNLKRIIIRKEEIIIIGSGTFWCDWNGTSRKEFFKRFHSLLYFTYTHFRFIPFWFSSAFPQLSFSSAKNQFRLHFCVTSFPLSSLIFFIFWVGCLVNFDRMLLCVWGSVCFQKREFSNVVKHGRISEFLKIS